MISFDLKRARKLWLWVRLLYSVDSHPNAFGAWRWIQHFLWPIWPFSPIDSPRQVIKSLRSVEYWIQRFLDALRAVVIVSICFNILIAESLLCSHKAASTFEFAWPWYSNVPSKSRSAGSHFRNTSLGRSCNATFCSPSVGHCDEWTILTVHQSCGSCCDTGMDQNLWYHIYLSIFGGDERMNIDDHLRFETSLGFTRVPGFWHMLWPAPGNLSPQLQSPAALAYEAATGLWDDLGFVVSDEMTTAFLTGKKLSCVA